MPRGAGLRTWGLLECTIGALVVPTAEGVQMIMGRCVYTKIGRVTRIDMIQEYSDSKRVGLNSR